MTSFNHCLFKLFQEILYCKKYLFILLLLLVITNCKNEPAFDIIISNGIVYDGTLDEPALIDIGIKGDKIIALGSLGTENANKIINAHGLSVSPGFIDLHVHLEPIFSLSNCESHLRQGVTTSLGGPDGNSPLPFGTYLDSLQKLGVGMNVGFLVGHNSVRKKIMNLDNRAPTTKELNKMKGIVAQAMNEGAFGISTGLKYLPGSFSEVDEIIALSKEASKKGGIYTSHLRDEGLEVLASIDEAIKISEKADITVILTHHKVIGKPMWGKSIETLRRVDDARERGLDIRIDQYPYNASHTGISVLIPSWARAGGHEMFKLRLENEKLRDSILNGIVFNILNDRGGEDLDRIQFAKFEWMPELEGKTLKYWCNLRGIEPTTKNGAKLVIEAQLRGGANCIFHAMDESDVINIMKHPQTMIASDGRLANYGVGYPHPRCYGTFPRVLGRYVRENKILTLKEAIHKMTFLPANAMGLKDRGLIQKGYKADLTIFDSDEIIDNGTYENPHQFPTGISYVIVNGKIVIDESKFKAIKPGVVLKKNDL